MSGESQIKESAEEWWTKLSPLLASKMQESGVAKLRIELNARGNYDFELVPTHPQAGDAKVEE
jgi:hypothetical protein